MLEILSRSEVDFQSGFSGFSCWIFSRKGGPNPPPRLAAPLAQSHPIAPHLFLPVMFVCIYIDDRFKTFPSYVYLLSWSMEKWRLWSASEL